MNLQNKQDLKLALVTGGARRVGAAIIKLLHAWGYRVLIHCHQSIKEAEALKNELNAIRPQSAAFVSCNLTDKNMPEILVGAAIKFAGRLDVVVNNASIFYKNELSTFEAHKWHDLFATNVEAPMRLSLEAYPHLKKTQGCIVNITDIHYKKTMRHYSIYCQTKAALWMQTQMLAREFAPEVRVNAVAPGAVEWPEGENALSEERKQASINETPLKRHGEGKWIAKAVLSLIENEFITGQTLSVDGGRSLV